MSEKVVLYYFNGRGVMESIRWLLAAAGVQFEEVLLTKREQFEKLLNDGALMFQQLPLVEIDGMQLVQSKAIMNYIAGKYNLNGSGLKERAMIEMYSEGLRDLMEMIMILPFKKTDEKETQLGVTQEKAKSRYFPVYEKALSGSQYLVGSQLSRADVHLMEATLMLEEKFPTILSTFPSLKAFQDRMRSLPTINKFLQPGSQRKPQPDDAYLKNVTEVLKLQLS
ncbi:glutathione S-transferase 3-like [Clupea harengus]|uniref:Glutathione S-transferase n=1 Tax=Clupea harengus TaxID=7950 RepID=A0A6P3WDX4_CLUHA|nr:glutathione S-transferase 3-like [Clupea harengus]